MISEFIQFHFEKFSLTDEELNVVKNVLQIVEIKKSEVFAEAGRKNRRLGAIVKGSLYSASVDKSGNEIIHNVFYEGEQYFAFDYESYLLDKPLEVSIKANEDSMLLTSSICRYPTFPTALK